MKYELRVPATNGDVIPLIVVASEMARAASTAYGKTLPHPPIYHGHLPIHIKSLLNEARAGRLRVCNQLGYQGTVEELITAATSSGDLSKVSRSLVEPDWERLERENQPVVKGLGVWDFTGIDLGPSEIDWDATYIGCLHAKLHHLNEWGNTNGDEFTISSDSVEWIDERGVMRPTEATAKTAKPVVAAGASGEAKKVETIEKRRARYLEWHVEESRINKHGALQRVFERERLQNPKVDRSVIGRDIAKARDAMKKQPNTGTMFGQLVRDGKRQR